MRYHAFCFLGKTYVDCSHEEYPESRYQPTHFDKNASQTTGGALIDPRRKYACKMIIYIMYAINK